ncbi:hypothetical protein O181_005463 [Austropuccinia psidii MF-1]|uniref:Uncharacterized protein n=1 Tax=Austropuccinia psidii MF-1 TaxID=1389203 RepID=A0A9Q3BIK2_9BASI|nr:hypothetical protein [Austropuccinia psidii MF-1]
MSNSPEAILNSNGKLLTELNIKWCDKINQIYGLKCAFGKGEVTITQWFLTEGIIKADHMLKLPTSHATGGSMTDLAFVVNYLVCHSMGLVAENWDLLDISMGYLLETHNCGA